MCSWSADTDNPENTHVSMQVIKYQMMMMMITTCSQACKRQRGQCESAGVSIHTQERMEKKQNAMVALAASEPCANGSSSGEVACH